MGSDLTRRAAARQGAEYSSLFERPWVGMVMVVFFILSDGLTLFMSFDAIISESPALLVLVTLASAVALDLPPYLAGKFLESRTISRKEKRLCIGLCGAVTAAMFALAFLLRWETRDALLTAGLGLGGEDAQADDSAARVLAITLGILPVLTSVMGFVVGMLARTDIAQVHRLEKLLLKSRQESARVRTMAQELVKHQSFSLEGYCADQAELMYQQLSRYQHFSGVLAREKLATHLNTQTATDALLGAAEAPKSAPALNLRGGNAYEEAC